jgi:hypothetical protein
MSRQGKEALCLGKRTFLKLDTVVDVGLRYSVARDRRREHTMLELVEIRRMLCECA